MRDQDVKIGDYYWTFNCIPERPIIRGRVTNIELAKNGEIPAYVIINGSMLTNADNLFITLSDLLAWLVYSICQDNSFTTLKEVFDVIGQYYEHDSRGTLSAVGTVGPGRRPGPACGHSGDSRPEGKAGEADQPGGEAAPEAQQDA